MTIAADTTPGKIAGREKEGVPLSMFPASPIPCPNAARLRRSDRLGGLIRGYKLADEAAG